jgi:hypothetical protein
MNIHDVKDGKYNQSSNPARIVYALRHVIDFKQMYTIWLLYSYNAW